MALVDICKIILIRITDTCVQDQIFNYWFPTPEGRLREVYTIYNSMCSPYLNDLNVFDRVQTIYDTRNKNSIAHNKCLTTMYGIDSFQYQGAKLWNEIRPDFKYLPSTEIL